MLDINEKPVHNYFVNAGVYFMETDVLERLEEFQFKDMPDLISELLDSNKKVAGFPVHEYWLDVGMHDEFERATNEYTNVFVR